MSDGVSKSQIIESTFLEDRILNGEEVSEDEIKDYFSLMNKVDMDTLKDYKKKYKKSMLKFEIELLKNKIGYAKNKDALSYSISYAICLKDKNIRTLKNSLYFTTTCEPTSDNVKNYILYTRYFDDYMDLDKELDMSIFNRTHNMALLMNVMDIDDKRKEIDSKYKDAIFGVVLDKYNRTTSRGKHV